MKETADEKDVSAIEDSSQTESRVPCQDAHAQRSRDTEQASRSGTGTAYCVKSCASISTSEETTVKKPSFSFPKTCRLRLHREFQRVYAHGKRVRGAHISLMVYRAPAGGGFKLGLSVRKKVYKRAVDRNRVKRRLREMVRLRRNELADDAWLVIHAEAGVCKASWQALLNEFDELCLRAGIKRATASSRD